MKKVAIISCVVLGVIGLTAFTYRNSEKESAQIKDTDTPVEIKHEDSSIPFNEASDLSFELKFSPRFAADNEPDLPFFYDYGPRFTGITKATIQNATSITDLFENDDIRDIVSYGKVSLILIENEEPSKIREISEGTTLTQAQLKLLKSLDYSDNFNLRADCERIVSGTAETLTSFHSPHMTIVPEKQAAYVNGKDALITYLADGSRDQKMLVEAKKMRPALLYFTVTKQGKITNVRIGNTSGYEDFDTKMIKLLKNLPGQWIPAENEAGEKVDQELVVSWGFKGC